jgi:hypothetical protein
MPKESTTPDLEEALRRSLEALIRRDYGGAVALFSAHPVVDMSPVGAGLKE